MDDDSDMFEIGLKRLDGNFQLWLSIWAPKLLGIEAYGIKPLRIFALTGSYGVRKDMRAVQSLDHAHASARVAWQARMRGWVNVFRAHPVAGFETRCRRRRPAVRTTFCDLLHIGQRERATS